jgi:choline kinase
MTQQTECHSKTARKLNEIIEENDLIYASRVLWLLKEMTIGQVRQMDKTNANYERFVGTVKSIIDFNLPQTFGFEIDFNPDYTKFRKLPYVQHSQSIFHEE